MKRLTSLLFPLIFLLTSCNIYFIKGTIVNTFELNYKANQPLDPNSKIGGIRGEVIGTYYTQVNENCYEIKLVEKNSHKIDSILNEFEWGDQIRFNRKLTRKSSLLLINLDKQTEKVLKTRKGYWRPREVKILK